MTRAHLIPQLSTTSGPAPAKAADAGLHEHGTPTADPRDGIEVSRGSGVTPQATPLSGGANSAQLLASIDALLSAAGSIRGQVGELGDVDFPIGQVREQLTFRYALTALHHQGLSRTASAAAAFAAGQAQATAATGAFSQTVGTMAGNGFALNGADVQALVQWVLREAYLEGTGDLRFYAEKVKFFNMQKKAIREQLATWRNIQTEFAGLTAEEKGNTNLDGTKNGSSGGGSGEGTVDGGAPIVTSAEQRARDYPEGNILVAEFLGYSMGGGRTALEDYVIKDDGARQRLIDAIPYMTTGELRQVIGALGGTDMKLASELSNVWGQIIDAMRPDQMFELAASPKLGEVWCFDVTAFSGSFGGLFAPRLRAMKARIETELGKSFGDDYGALARAYRQHRRDALTAAEREAYGAADDSTLDAINALNDANPQGLITTEQLLALIRDSTGDHDAQAAGIEYDDLAAFIEEHSGRLTPGALAAWQTYSTEALAQRAQGRTGIPSATWEAMIASIEQLAVEHAAADAALLAAPEEEAQEQGTVEPDVLIGDLDIDPSDGSIDDVMLNDVPPPYLLPSGEKITTVAGLETAIKNLEDKMASVGDDAQLANVDLQNMLQKQQQLIQMLSNVAKMLHDTAMAVIRKMAA